MKASPDMLPVREVLAMKAQQMLVVNPEYQRGAAWRRTQQKKLLDSLLRGYPLPLFYFHHFKRTAAGIVNQAFEIIDGQQRINALSDYVEGKFKLLDPLKDDAEARFPDFIKKLPCPWAGKTFHDLSSELQTQLRETPLQIVKIECNDKNEARDLFVRLQAGMPLTSQEKRDAWPGQFTDFVLRLAGKSGLDDKYPGHVFFNELLKARTGQDRGKLRQLAAQVAMVFLAHRLDGSFLDISAPAIDTYYYKNLDFDAESPNAKRLFAVLDKVSALLRDQKRPKISAHETIHLVLLIDALLDDYTRSWESKFADAFDDFRRNVAQARDTRYGSTSNEYWVKYGESTRVASDQGSVIQRRHEFFAEKMLNALSPRVMDTQRAFGSLERELIYYRDKKRCAVCGAEVFWSEAEIHHIEQHSRGGQTTLGNGALVHEHCHPKGLDAIAFEKKWQMDKNARLEDAPRGDIYGNAGPAREYADN